MIQPFMSFHEYDRLCDKLEDFTIKKEDIDIDETKIRLMLHGDMLFTNMLFLTWVAENGAVDRDTVKLINREVSARFSFSSKSVPNRTKLIMTYDEYSQIAQIWSDVLITDWEPSEDDLKNIISPYARFCPGLLYAVLKKATDEKSPSCKRVRRIANSNIEVLEGDMPVELGAEDYSEIMKKIGEISVPDDDTWWPDIQQVTEYIKPNAAKCVPFLLYLLREGHVARTGDEEYVKKMLEMIVERTMHVRNMGDVIWS